MFNCLFGQSKLSQSKMRVRFNHEDAIHQALCNLVVVLLVEVLYFVFLVLPTVETRLKRIAVGDSHAIYSRSNCIHLVFAYTV